MRYRIIGYLGSFASIISLSFFNEIIWLRIAVIIIGTFSLIYFFILEFIESRKHKLIKCKNDEEIKNYMYDWVSTSGMVSVFSRNLSWVDDKIKTLMIAKGADLTICAEKPTPLTDELLKAGVNIYFYGKFNFSPLSRFTIIKANKPDKQIAIGSSLKQNFKNNHYIYESKNENLDKWLLDIASDLVNITICINNKP